MTHQPHHSACQICVLIAKWKWITVVLFKQKIGLWISYESAFILKIAFELKLTTTRTLLVNCRERITFGLQSVRKIMLNTTCKGNKINTEQNKKVPSNVILWECIRVYWFYSRFRVWITHFVLDKIKYTCSSGLLLCKTNRFDFVVVLFSYRSQRRQKVATTPMTKFLTNLFLPNFDVICDLYWTVAETILPLNSSRLNV